MAKRHKVLYRDNGTQAIIVPCAVPEKTPILAYCYLSQSDCSADIIIGPTPDVIRLSVNSSPICVSR